MRHHCLTRETIRSTKRIRNNYSSLDEDFFIDYTSPVMKEFLTTPEVAEMLGVSIRRVQQFINEGRLPSQQFGREHLIKESDLALVAERKAGRPKKEGAAVNDSTGAKTATAKPTKKGATKARR
jgi:excisionase family DNA binding protein